MPIFKVKRAYQDASPDDGQRVLVDHIWPRGLSKARLDLQAWDKTLAPSGDLRKWFNHDPAKWEAFKAAYFKELDARPEAVAALRALAAKGTVTLVYAARDEAHNNALALKEYLEKQTEKHG